MSPKRRELIASIGAIGATTTLGVGATMAEVGAFDSLSGQNGQDGERETARVRVAHASPDAPNVDVFFDDNRVLSDVPFRAVSNYLSVPAGSYGVRITAAGDADTVAFEGEVTVEAGIDYTVAAVGELSEDTFQPRVLIDRNRRLPDSIAEVRVFHASPDAPAVDVTAGHFTLADGISFGDVGHYSIIPAGEQTVNVRPCSTLNTLV